ncbi:MAG TPA: hypothetical protein VH438_14950 [Gemmatimonadales bacterium]
MSPSIGHASEARGTSAWSSCAAAPGRSVRACTAIDEVGDARRGAAQSGVCRRSPGDGRIVGRLQGRHRLRGYGTGEDDESPFHEFARGVGWQRRERTEPIVHTH